MAILADTSANYHLAWLFLPLLTMAISFIAGYFIYYSKRKQVDEYLRKGRNEAYWIALAIVEIIFTGGLIEAADFSAMINGELSLGSLIACTLLPFSFATFVVTQTFGSYHHFRSQERFEHEQIAKWKEAVASLKRDIKVMEEQYTYSDRVRSFLTALIESDQAKLQGVADRFESRLSENEFGEHRQRIAPLPKSWFLKHANPRNIQLATIVVVLQEVLEQIHPRQNKAKNKVRVGLFERKNDSLRAIASYDGRQHNILKSPVRDAEKFKLTNGKGCLAVEAAFLAENEFACVPDASEGHVARTCGFSHFDSEQANRIRSILAFPIRFHSDPEPSASYVICADCDRLNYFSDDMKHECSILADYAKMRLSLAGKLDEILQCVFHPSVKSNK